MSIYEDTFNLRTQEVRGNVYIRVEDVAEYIRALTQDVPPDIDIRKRGELAARNILQLRFT